MPLIADNTQQTCTVRGASLFDGICQLFLTFLDVNMPGDDKRRACIYLFIYFLLTRTPRLNIVLHRTSLAFVPVSHYACGKLAQSHAL